MSSKETSYWVVYNWSKDGVSGVGAMDIIVPYTLDTGARLAEINTHVLNWGEYDSVVITNWIELTGE